MKGMILLFLAGPALAWADGVIGVGNSGDLSIQLKFAQTTAVSMLKQVDLELLGEVTASIEEKNLYAVCRRTMFEGAVKTSFNLVDSIDDGQGYHALARRRPGFVIEISRKMLEQVSAADPKTTLLIAVVLHEVGHDCTYRGHPVDDSYDDRLNSLAVDLISASNSTIASSFVDVDLIERVNAGESVHFAQISKGVRLQLVNSYLDVVGDYVYDRYSDIIGTRPAPASNFFADKHNSWTTGWASVKTDSIPGEGIALINSILRGSSQQSEFWRIVNNTKRAALPTQLTCVPNQSDSGTIACTLDVSWEELAGSLTRMYYRVKFELNIFSELTVRDIALMARPGGQPGPAGLLY